MHIGLDDTDSTRKGCTTYITALLVEKLQTLGVSFVDYPNLIRLNPNVPWKTRGNGALCLRIRFDETLEKQIKELNFDKDFYTKSSKEELLAFYQNEVLDSTVDGNSGNDSEQPNTSQLVDDLSNAPESAQPVVGGSVVAESDEIDVDKMLADIDKELS
jgi:hypothetical protein